MPVDLQYSLPVDALNLIVKSKSLPVESTLSNSTIEFDFPVDSQYSSPVEAFIHLIVESKSLPVEVNNWSIKAKGKLPIIFKINYKNNHAYGSETYDCITTHSKHTGNTFTKAFLGLKYQVLAFLHSLLNSTTNLDNNCCFSKAL